MNGWMCILRNLWDVCKHLVYEWMDVYLLIQCSISLWRVFPSRQVVLFSFCEYIILFPFHFSLTWTWVTRCWSGIHVHTVAPTFIDSNEQGACLLAWKWMRQPCLLQATGPTSFSINHFLRNKSGYKIAKKILRKAHSTCHKSWDMCVYFLKSIAFELRATPGVL